MDICALHTWEHDVKLVVLLAHHLAYERLEGFKRRQSREKGRVDTRGAFFAYVSARNIRGLGVCLVDIELTPLG